MKAIWKEKGDNPSIKKETEHKKGGVILILSLIISIA